MRKRYPLTLVLGLLWLCTRCVPAPAQEPSGIHVTPSRVPANTLTLSESLTWEAERELATPIPGGGATVMARIATIRAAYTPPPTATPHYGILEHGDDVSLQSSFAPGGMLASNAWRGRVDGELLLVYAGTLDPFDTLGQPRDVRQVGRLVVQGKRQVYETTAETGALIIVGECHGRLLLTTAGSDTLPPQEMTYDLRTYQMSDGHPTDCVPTATDTPTPHTE